VAALFLSKLFCHDVRMKVRSSFKFHIAFALFCFAILAMLNLGNWVTVYKRPGDLLFAPPQTLQKFTFGYSEITADSFWLRLIQDIDLCEQNFAPVGASRIDPNRVHNCNQGWGYHILKVIFACAPRWRQPAAVGPIMLSVVVDDIEGASLLFKEVTKAFPHDWPILFRAGYHFLYETNDHVLAARYFDEAGKNGAPAWVHSLSAKLYSENGRDQVALLVLRDALARAPTGPSRAAILRRLKMIEAKVSRQK
jgi:hypothetical protein